MLNEVVDIIRPTATKHETYAQCMYIYIYNIQALRAFRRAYLRATNIEERTSSSKETIIRAKLHITNYYSASSEKPLQGGIKEAARRQNDWGGSGKVAPRRHQCGTEKAPRRQSDWGRQSDYVTTNEERSSEDLTNRWARGPVNIYIYREREMCVYGWVGPYYSL